MVVAVQRVVIKDLLFWEPESLIIDYLKSILQITGTQVYIYLSHETILPMKHLHFLMEIDLYLSMRTCTPSPNLVLKHRILTTYAKSIRILVNKKILSDKMDNVKKTETENGLKVGA